ncbi:hypothetical protein IKF81_01990 [Candidatus Saccharibacteria bacterium]|nr:hypothetical protein [Candidatus Saccharibacteria bacterium]
MLKTTQETKTPVLFSIIATKEESIILNAVDDGVTKQDFATIVLNPFLESGTKKEEINSFFVKLLVGELENAAIKQLDFQQDGIAISYELYLYSKSKKSTVTKRYKNFLTYRNTDYFALNLQVNANEEYLILFEDSTVTVVSDGIENTFTINTARKVAIA